MSEEDEAPMSGEAGASPTPTHEPALRFRPGDEASRLIPSPQGGGGLKGGPAFADPEPFLAAGNNRRMQVRRKPRRKLFGKRRKEDFLEALACTGNVAAAAEAAGVTVGTIYNHRRKDPEFRQAFWLALEQSVAKLVALRVQRELERAERVARGQLYTTVPGEERGQSASDRPLAVRLDGPPDEKQIVDLMKLMQMLRDLCRNLSGPEPGAGAAKRGSRERQVASPEEIVAALEKRLKAFRRRRAAEAAARDGGGCAAAS